MGIKIGICGAAGKFSKHFITLFQAHPQVDEVYLADLRSDALAERAAEFGINTTYADMDELCASDCDAIAIFTQRWTHAPLAVQALKAGKHVYSAVPAAITLEEIEELVQTVKETGRVYMLGETSYYRAQTTYCRDAFARGEFGAFVYGEGQYHHDMAHFYASYRSNGPRWKELASFPPMLYPTHSVAFVLGVTFRRVTEVCCFGYTDDHPDGIFNEELSRWGNVYSNQSALCRTSDGGMARINEFRRTGNSMMDRMSVVGTLGAYHEQPRGESGDLSNVFTRLDFPEDYGADGVIPFDKAKETVKLRAKDLNDLCVFDGVTITEENLGALPREYLGKTFLGISKAQPYGELPLEFAGLPNGHEGTHVFLVNDCVRAMAANVLPPNHVWLAARYNAPGIVAHESCKRDGERLTVPDFGMPPADWPRLDTTRSLQP